jgi:hypothetical protein
MKKTFKLFGAFLFASVLLASCGGGSEEGEEGKISLPEPPKDIKYSGVQLIDGPLSGYVEVVPGDYLLELEKDEDEMMAGYSGKMKVKFRFLKSMDVKAGTGYNQFGPSLLGKALDAQGAPLDFDLDISADKDLATYLKRGSGEEWLTLTISGQGSVKSTEEGTKMLEKFKSGKQIRFNSEIVKEEFDTEEDSEDSEDSDDKEEVAAAGDCDELLSDYEDFMDDYVDILEDYADDPTDPKILGDYNKLMKEATKWSTKTASCATDASFAAKFAEIQAKIASAASGI